MTIRPGQTLQVLDHLGRFAGLLVVVSSRGGWRAGPFGIPMPDATQPSTHVVRWAGSTQQWEVGDEQLQRMIAPPRVRA